MPGMTPEEIELEAARLDAESARMKAQAEKLRLLATKQRELDKLLEDASPGLPTVRSDGSMDSAQMSRTALTPEHRLKISMAMSKRFRGQPMFEAMVKRRLSPSDYARIIKKPVSTVASWMDPDPKNGRKVPCDQAQFAELFFGKDERGKLILPAADASYAHGISHKYCEHRAAR